MRAYQMNLFYLEPVIPGSDVHNPVAVLNHGEKPFNACHRYFLCCDIRVGPAEDLPLRGCAGTQDRVTIGPHAEHRDLQRRRQIGGAGVTDSQRRRQRIRGDTLSIFLS